PGKCRHRRLSLTANSEVLFRHARSDSPTPDASGRNALGGVPDSAGDDSARFGGLDPSPVSASQRPDQMPPPHDAEHCLALSQVFRHIGRLLDEPAIALGLVPRAARGKDKTQPHSPPRSGVGVVLKCGMSVLLWIAVEPLSLDWSTFKNQSG